MQIAELPRGCDNAPRKVVIRDFVVALYEKDAESLQQTVSPDVNWRVVGGQVYSGIDDVLDWVSTLDEVKKLRFHTIITHGNECGVDGEITLNSGTTFGFSHMLRFTGGAKTAKISQIRTYSVDV